MKRHNEVGMCWKSIWRSCY